MEVLADVSLEKVQGKILCCECGTTIDPNPANMCVACLRTQVDITEGIPKQVTIHFCKNCERYLNPPQQWVNCALESRELMALCLKKLKNLPKVKLIDATFVWTEPHSKRLKVKLTIQSEVGHLVLSPVTPVLSTLTKCAGNGRCHPPADLYCGVHCGRSDV